MSNLPLKNFCCHELFSSFVLNNSPLRTFVLYMIAHDNGMTIWCHIFEYLFYWSLSENMQEIRIAIRFFSTSFFTFVGLGRSWLLRTVLLSSIIQTWPAVISFLLNEWTSVVGFSARFPGGITYRWFRFCLHLCSLFTVIIRIRYTLRGDVPKHLFIEDETLRRAAASWGERAIEYKLSQ